MSASAPAPEDRLAERIGYEFRDHSRLRRALTHASALGNVAPGAVSNERLEFLGDRVLGLIVADMLIDAFPHEAEGALARRHAYLVSREPLAEVARALKLGEFLLISKSEADCGGRENPGLLADVCEAIIGAIYRDGGLEAARAFVRRHWRPLLAQDRKPPQDPKTALQEWAQGRGLPRPTYREVAREGPPHDPHFTVAAEVRGEAPTTGEGRSKRLAEQEAARHLLARVRGEASP